MRFSIFNFICFFIGFIAISKASAANSCFDRSPSCPEHAQLCNTSRFLQEFCPKTCEVCSQANACEVSNGGCNQLCSSVNETVSCSCYPGFRLQQDGKTCIDINECTEGPNPCNSFLPEYCVNSVGSYSCHLYDCERSEPGTTNYYKSDKCCTLKNGSCGLTASLLKKRSESQPQPRIFGGEEAASSAWPWMVQLLNNRDHLCGGTLLTDRWVVTAASCLKNISAESINVHLGHIRNSFIQFLDHSRTIVRRVARKVIHPDFETNNIALIELSETVPFDETTRPICLPCGEIPREGDKCWATGFGIIEFNIPEVFSRILSEVDLPIVNINKCAQAFETNVINSDTMMCAGYKQGEKDACKGDGGGPLVCQRRDSCEWYLSGITLFGAECRRPSNYGVFAKVIEYETWIRNVLGENARDLCGHGPCNGLRNTKEDCESILDVCESKERDQCSFTCCQRRAGIASNCFDDPKAVTTCYSLKENCRTPRLQPYLQKYCKKTCNFC